VERRGDGNSFFGKESLREEGGHTFVIVDQAALMPDKCRDQGRASPVAPGGYFPDVGRGDVLVGPAPLGLPNHLFEVFIGLPGFLIRPEPSLGG
jgi:hypothetical protein